jgi:hypothetical protein
MKRDVGIDLPRATLVILSLGDFFAATTLRNDFMRHPSMSWPILICPVYLAGAALLELR